METDLDYKSLQMFWFLSLNAFELQMNNMCYLQWYTKLLDDNHHCFGVSFSAEIVWRSY